MKERKIVQVATSPENTRMHAGLYALADDGSLWWRRADFLDNLFEWHPVPSLPPREDESEKEGEK